MNEDVTKSYPVDGQSEAKPPGIVQRLLGSLAFKVGAAVIATEILVLTGIGIPLNARHDADIDRTAVERILIPGTLLQASVLSYASVADRRIMTDLLGEELIDGMMVGGNGNVFYSLDSGHLGRDVAALPGIDPDWFDSSETERQLIETRADGETFLISITPLFTLDSKVPSLFAYIKTNTTKLTEEKAEWRRLTFIGGLAVVLTTSLIIFMSFQMLIFRRIVRSADFVQQVREGDLETRVATPGGDEFGTLERGMNEMVANLKRRQEQQTEAEATLRESEENFRQLTDNIRDVFWMTDPDKSRMLYISPGYEDVWGRSRKSLYEEPKSFLDAIDPRDRPRVTAAMAHQALGIYDETYRIVRPDGSLRWIRDRAFPVRNEVGQVYRIAGIAEDITEIVEQNEQLRQSQKMEAVGQLTAGVAHDFNNLLGIILGNAELLEERLEDNDTRDLLGPVIRATQRGAELTSRLLAFSRQQPLKPQAIDIGELCKRIMGLLRRTLGETIEIDLRIGELSPAYADPGQLENALLNLALNARDAMTGGGTLTIETGNVTLTGADMDVHWDGQSGDYVVLKVSDSGTGMAPDVVERVFEPFFTTKEIGAGSGLGLSMVYGFAKQSGGHVTIESEEGHGTTVALYLPQAEAAGEDAQPEAAGEVTPRGQGETILVVEDEPALRRTTVRQLENLGYRTLDAPDGPVALAILADSPEIDLLLSDVVLPGGMNGPQIYQQVREQHPDLRCLFMSGYASTPEDPLPDGVDLLSKPFGIANLAQKLRSTLAA